MRNFFATSVFRPLCWCLTGKHSLVESDTHIVLMLQVTAMLSEEGEKLSLKTTFNPKAAGGNVEKWFIEAEAAMRETVKDVTRKSFDAHAVSKRIDWVLQWPGQVSINQFIFI